MGELRVICPLGVVGDVDGLVRPDVRVTEEIARRDNDITKRVNVVNGSEPIFRSLCVVCGFVTVSMETREVRRSDVY